MAEDGTAVRATLEDWRKGKEKAPLSTAAGSSLCPASDFRYQSRNNDDGGPMSMVVRPLCRGVTAQGKALFPESRVSSHRSPPLECQCLLSNGQIAIFERACFDLLTVLRFPKLLKRDDGSANAIVISAPPLLVRVRYCTVLYSYVCRLWDVSCT